MANDCYQLAYWRFTVGYSDAYQKAMNGIMAADYALSQLGKPYDFT